MLHIPPEGLGSLKQVMGKTPSVYTKNCHISGPKSYLEVPSGEERAAQEVVTVEGCFDYL